MDVFEEFQRQLDELREDLASVRAVRFERGVVKALNPLRIALDSDPTVTLDGTPDNICPVLAVGDYVKCLRESGGRVTVLGVLPGTKHNYVEAQVSGGVNGTWVETGASDSTSEPSFRLRRSRDTGSAYARMYVSNASNSRTEVGISVQDLGLGVYSVFYFNGNAGTIITRGPDAVRRPLPFAMATGYVATGGTANTVLSHTVTFPSGRFTSSPEIFVLPNSGVPNAISVSYSGRSANGFTLNTYRTNTTTYNVSWFAIQLEP